jgi:hypothetical protein
MQDLLATIANPETDQRTVAQSIRALGPPSEDPHFWTAIANSDRHTAEHRRRAVVALFERHARPPLTLAELARTLDGATWLTDDDVDVVRELGGMVPVTFDLENSVFVLRLLPETPRDRRAAWAVYLRVEGTLGLEAFRNAVHGRSTDVDVLGRRVLEVGLPSVDGEPHTMRD